MNCETLLSAWESRSRGLQRRSKQGEKHPESRLLSKLELTDAVGVLLVNSVDRGSHAYTRVEDPRSGGAAHGTRAGSGTDSLCSPTPRERTRFPTLSGRRSRAQGDPRAHSEGGAFGVSPEEASEPIRHPEPDGPFGWRSRAWYTDHYHWRMETEVPGGGVQITASKGRRRVSIGGPAGSGLV